MGCEIVCEVGDGHEAIEYLQSEDGGVDVLLTDIKMGAVSGIELSKYVSENHPHIKNYNPDSIQPFQLCTGSHVLWRQILFT